MHNILTFIFSQITPPAGFPMWLIPILGFVLPWIYNLLIKNLARALCLIAAWILSLVVSVGVAIIAKISIWSVFPWLITCIQFIYTLIVKPVMSKTKGAV